MASSNGKHPTIHDIAVLGISHQTADLQVRERFSLPLQAANIFKQQAKQFAHGVFVISTCNRTEIYLHGAQMQEVLDLWLKLRGLSHQEFEKYGFIKRDFQAVRHLFSVAAGLDSQIIGDFEVAGQLKKAIENAEERNSIDNILLRLAQFALQASKRVKNETKLSNGAASIAYTAVQYIRARSSDLNNKQVLLYGTGKIGSSACFNLLKQISPANITLVNRTFSKAKALGARYKVTADDHSQLEHHLANADIVIVATSAPAPTVTNEHFGSSTKPKLLIDLSVPRNIEASVAEMPGITLADVDQLTELRSEALAQRKASIPQANVILKEKIEEFLAWVEIRSLAPTFQALKDKLEEIRVSEVAFHKASLKAGEKVKVDHITARITQTIAKHCINHLKANHQSAQKPEAVIREVFNLNNGSEQQD